MNGPITRRRPWGRHDGSPRDAGQTQISPGVRVDPGTLPRPSATTEPSEFVSPGRDRLAGALALVGGLLVANLCVALYVANERTIYYWDFIGYWNLSRVVVNLEKSAPSQLLSFVLSSIAKDDYNLLAAVPIGSWMTVVGESRIAYVLGVVNIYAGASLLAMMALARSFRGPRESSQGGWIELVPVAVVLLVPAFWSPILFGYADVGGVALALIVLRLYFTSTSRPAFQTAYITIGLMLAGLFLFRRWYAFWVVAFFVVATVDRTFLLVRESLAEGLSVRRALKAWGPLAVMGAVTAATLVTLALPMLRHVIATDYSDLLSAYNSDEWTLVHNLKNSEHWLGSATLLYGLAALIGLAFARGTRRLAFFVAAQAAFILCHFSRVQNFGHHHLYLLLPGLLVVLSVFTSKVASRLPGGLPRRGWLGAVLAFGVLNSVATFSASARPVADALGRLVPWPRYPQTRSDLGELIRMMSAVDDEVQKRDGGVYVLGASPLFSADHLVYGPWSLPVTFRAVDRIILQAPHVDKNDGFPKKLLEAEYVLVGSPIQYGLRPSDQQVIGTPAEMLLNGTGIGRAFERLPQHFTLEDGATVHLYKKARPFEPSEVAELSDRLRASYPDRPFVYDPNAPGRR